MVKVPNLAAIIAAATLSCGEAKEVTEDTAPLNVITQEQQVAVQEVLNEPQLSPEELARVAEDAAWQLVVNATPGIDARDKVESLWNEPTPEFSAYLALWREHDLGLRPFYDRGLLPEGGASGFEAYKDQAPEYQRFINYSENVNNVTSRNTSYTEEERQQYLNRRTDQIDLAQRISDLIASRNNEANNVERYIAPFFDFEAQVNQRNLEGNEYVRTSADPILGLAIMMYETFPGPPNGVDYTPEMRFAMMLALLQDGYYPNHTLSTGRLDGAEARINCLSEHTENHCRGIYGDDFDLTKSITVAFPQLIYNTATGVFTQNSEEIVPAIFRMDLEGDSVDPDFTSRNLFNVVNDMDVAVLVFAYLNWDNRRRMDSSEAFFNDPNNRRAFRALSAYFNHQGATRPTFREVKQWLTDANYNQDAFVAKLSSENRYTSEVVRIADFLDTPKIQEFLSRFRPSESPSR